MNTAGERRSYHYLSYALQNQADTNWFTLEWPQIQRAAEWIFVNGGPSLVFEYVFAVDPFFRRIGRWQEQFSWWSRALEASLLLQDSGKQAICYNGIGTSFAARGSGNGEQALENYQLALSCAKEAGDRGIESAALCNIGITLVITGTHLQQALEYCRKALTIAIELQDLVRECLYTGNMGIILGQIGNVDEAHNYLNRALRLAQEAENPHYINQWMGNLASLNNMHVSQKEQWDQILEQVRELGDTILETTWLGTVSSVFVSHGNIHDALEQCWQAISLARQLGDREREVGNLAVLSGIYSKLSDHENAAKCYRYLIDLSTELGMRKLTASGWLGLASLAEQQGDTSSMLSHYDQALHVTKELEDVNAEGMLLIAMGLSFSALDNIDRARACFQQALILHKGSNNSAGLAVILMALAHLDRLEGHIESAIDLDEQALEASKQSVDRESEALVYRYLGFNQELLGHAERALAYYQQSLALWEQIGNIRRVNEIRWITGLFLESTGHLEQAIVLLQDTIDSEQRFGSIKANEHIKYLAQARTHLNTVL